MNGTVTSWRDDVSKSLGGLEEGMRGVHQKLDNVCKTQKAQDKRIDDLEEIESNRSAVQKKITAIHAGIIAVITVIANIAFKVFN